MKNKNDVIAQAAESAPKVKARFSTESSRRGALLVGITVVVIALTIFVNLLVGMLPDYMLSLDLSDQKIYSISDTSVDYLEDLDNNIELTMIAEYGSVDERISKFVYQYASLSDKISVKEVDPMLYPSILTQYETEADTLVVKNLDTGKFTVVNFGAYYSDAFIIYDFDWENTSTYEKAFDGEGQLTSAIEYVTKDISGVCYQLTGHDEEELSDACLSIIKKASLDVSKDSLNILKSGGIPEDCDLLFINNPVSDLADDELAVIREYMQAGGNVMLFIDNPSLKNFASLCSEYGLNLLEGFIGDTESYYKQYANSFGYYCISPFIATSTAGGHNIDGDAILIQPKGMSQVSPERSSISVEAFMTTSDNGIKYIDADNVEYGKYILGATASESLSDGSTSTFTVVSAISMIKESLTSMFSNMSNMDIFSNCVLNATDVSASLIIPSKSLEYSYVTINNTVIWSALLIAIIPLGVLATGLVIWIRRRKR